MDGKQKMNVTNGVISGVVLLCGVLFAALMASLGGMDIRTSAVSSTWAYCFAYITPGILGIVAACTRKRGLYITHLVICILTLILMGYVSYYSIILLSAIGAIDESCLSYGDLCTCSHLTAGSLNRSCDSLQKMHGMLVAVLVILILAWGFTLANCVMSGILGNKPVVSPPVFIQQVPQTTVVQLNTTRHAPPQYMPPQDTYMQPQDTYMTPQGAYMTPQGTYMTHQGAYMTPQGPPPPKYHDTAELVNNVEY